MATNADAPEEPVRPATVPIPAKPASRPLASKRVPCGNVRKREVLLSYSNETGIAALAAAGIVVHLTLRYALGASQAVWMIPIYPVLILGGAPLLLSLSRRLVAFEFGSDLLAGISIIAAVLLGEYLVASIVVLMLSGGTALEQYATRRASSVLDALARRMPQIAHRRLDAGFEDVGLDGIAIGDILIVLPHEICPVDGVVIEGHGHMDEAYLTGEPFRISKTPGTTVLSGAINGDTALTIRASRLPVDSRYASIMKVVQASQEHRPPMRRLGDRLGALYTPVAVGVGIAAWVMTGDPSRFLAVVVIATPCPLLLAIPIAIIGSISLAARRGIVIKDPALLEQLDSCRTIILDKTGTLTYGVAQLTHQITATPWDARDVLTLVASLEQYSKHPLARSILNAAHDQKLELAEASEMSEAPGQGLRGIVSGRSVLVTNRAKLIEQDYVRGSELPAVAPGLECVIAIDGAYAATYRFHDSPRPESKPFIRHLGRKHRFTKIMLVSGDREPEVRYLADRVGVDSVYSSQSPEQKVGIVRKETQSAKTLFLGDGINDAPALMTATVGVAFGQSSDITSEAAGAVIMDASLSRVDELFHIGHRMRSIGLQSALGGMFLSVVGMAFAMAGLLPPLEGAVAQEIIDVLAIVNALRAAFPPKTLVDF